MSRKEVDCFDVFQNNKRMTRSEIAGFQADFNVNLHADQDEDDALLDGDTDDLADLTILEADQFVRQYIESFDVFGKDDADCWCAP
jgi:hypothetical protein